jgi:CRP-like cAMP-binding protein
MLTNNTLLRYVAKLERRGALPQRERDALLSLPSMRRDHAANETIISAGDVATHCVIVDSGLLSRTKHLGTGARQIVAFHVPGDAVDLQSVLFARSDHEIRSHMPSRTCWIAHADVLALTRDYPIIANALWLDTLVDSAIFREWTANVGQRNAKERIAHLFLELAARFEAIGMLNDDSYVLSVTQSNLAEALGLSLVHMNKSLQALHKGGYLTFKDRRVTLRNRPRLVAMTNFDTDYLHLDGGRVKDPCAMALPNPRPHLDKIGASAT